MATKDENITRGHELYIRHISLLGKAVPLALKAVIRKIEAKLGKTLDSILTEKRDTIKTFYYDLFQALFKEEEDGVNTQTESWGLFTLCGVIFVLSESSELNCVICISDQLRDVEKYTNSASLEYNTYKQKWESLRESLLELVKGSEAEYECKRLIHSYDESEAITVSEGVIKKLKQTKNVDRHIRVAITSECALDGLSKTEEDPLNGKGSKVDCNDILEQTTEFIQPLSDKFVHADESVVLFCELNTAESETEWRKNGKPLLQTKTVKAFADKGNHWLLFARARTIDTGEYSCICKNVSTSACVTVSKQDLMVIEDLHADVDGQVKENTDISLVCTVNVHTKSPQWFLNNKEITQTSRVVAVSQGLEHKLIIRNVQFEDDGVYVIAFDRVTSRTTLAVKGEADPLVKQQISEKLYNNWIRGVLGLKYLKLGIEGVAEKEVKRRHTEILNALPNSKQPCTQCSTDSLYPLHDKKQCYRKQNKKKCLCSDYQHNRQPCPNKGYCSLFYDQIVSDHRFENPELENTKLDRWSNDPWSVATCYINTKGYKGKGSSKEIDCAGLLSLFINNRRYLTDVNYGVFDMARTTRNEILHNANYELSDDQLHENFDNIKDVLEVKNNANKMVFAKDESVKEALKNIDKLKQHQINIVTLEEIQNLKDHAMQEAADTFKEAQKQRDQEVQHLNEKLKKAEEELKLIRQLRSAFQRDSRLEEKTELLELVLRLGIRVVTPMGESASEVIQRVHGFIQYAVKHSGEDSIPPTVHTYKKTYKSVQHILGKIFVSQDTQVEVLQDQSDVSFKINCISSKDLEKRLTIYRGVQFQEAIADLQKSLETEDERKWKYDVETSCSSQDLKDIIKQLSDHGVLNGSCTDFRCEMHDGTQCSWYCGEHDKFFCKSCKDTNHRSCFGLNKLGEREVQGKLEVKFKGFVGPQPGFKISSICTLPSGEVLIGSRRSTDLLKLDSSYDLISRCVLPSSPSGVCYIGNGRAAAVCGNKLVFLDITSNKESHEALHLNFEMKSIACHGDTIYICDRESLYTCNTNGTNLRTLYFEIKKQSILDAAMHCIYLESNFESIAVSDNGETIYIIDQSKLHIIHSNGDLLSTKEIIPGPVGICCLGNDLIVGCNWPDVLKQLDFKGNMVKIHEFDHFFSILSLSSLCCDKKRSKLIVGRERGSLLIFDILYTV